MIGFLGDPFRFDMGCLCCGVCAAAGRTRLDRRPQRRDRVSLGGGTRRTLRRNRRRVRPAEGRSHRHQRWCSARIEAGDLRHSDRLCGGKRPAGQRPGREPGAAGRQCHWTITPGGRSRRQANRGFARGIPRVASDRDHGRCRLSGIAVGDRAGRDGGSHARDRSRQAGIQRAEDILGLRQASGERRCARVVPTL